MKLRIQVGPSFTRCLGPVCDQDNVMEFGLDQLRTGLRPGSSYLDMSR